MSPVYWTDCRGDIVNDYDAKYEEYKKALLQNHWFIKTLHEKYRASLNGEKDYIDNNGVLWKVGLLGAVCGFCIAFTPIENGNWILGLVLFLAIMGSVIWARHIESKFKKNLGETIFYAFRYQQHFSEYVQEEKYKETKKLLKDMLNHYDDIRWRADSIQTMSEEDVKSLFLNHIKKMGNYEAQYQELDNYDSFLGSLKNDYYFNAEIQKDIDKYI
jgi:hypothetical protein